MSQVSDRRDEVASLWRKGLTAPQIAEVVRAPLSTVRMDLHYLRQIGDDIPRRKAHPQNKRVQERRREVAKLWDEGRTAPEIAKAQGVSTSVINSDLRWMKASGVIQSHDPAQHPHRIARRKAVGRLWQAGLKAHQIANALGIQRSTVYEDLDRLRAEGEDLEYRVPALIGNRCQQGNG